MRLMGQMGPIRPMGLMGNAKFDGIEWQRMAIARFTRLMASRQNYYSMPFSTLQECACH